MPDRPNRRRSRRRPGAEGQAPQPRRWRWQLPSRQSWGRAGWVAAGAVLGLVGLGLIWPEQDPSLKVEAPATAANLADVPRRAVTVLVIGSDADKLKATSNGAAPRGPANSDALVLIRVNPRGPIQILNLPTELAVQIPGQKRPQSLGSLYREGGPALVADTVREVLGLERPAPDRYVVVPRGTLRALVNGVGGVELNPPLRMRYEDRSLKYRIDLQGGLQELSGAQVEQMVRFRERNYGDSGRRANQQLVLTGLRERLAQPEQLRRLPMLLQSLSGEVDTNLSTQEALSLLAAGLDSKHPLAFSALSLSPAKPSHGKLRQLPGSAPRQLWPAP